MSLEDLVKETIIRFGKEADMNCIQDVLFNNGFQDEDGLMSSRIMEMIDNAEVRVKVRY